MFCINIEFQQTRTLWALNLSVLRHIDFRCIEETRLANEEPMNYAPKNVLSFITKVALVFALIL